MILKKSSVPGALVGTFASGDQLHCDINRVGVQERLAGDKSGFPGVGIVGDQPGKKYSGGGCFVSIVADILNIATDVFVVAGNYADRVAVGGYQRGRAQNESCIPLEVGTLERSAVDAALVASQTLQDPANGPGLRRRAIRR
jgi:hypothetical protein